MILARNTDQEIAQIRQALDDPICIKELGELWFFLGFEVAWTKKGILMCLRKFTVELLSDPCLLGC